MCLPAADLQSLYVAPGSERPGESAVVANSSEVWGSAERLSRLCFQISGALYRSNVLCLQKLLFAPMWLSRVGRRVLEPLFSSESGCWSRGKARAEGSRGRTAPKLLPAESCTTLFACRNTSGFWV